MAVIRYAKEALRFIAAMSPFILFALIYNSMRYYPNYLVNDIDTEGVYTLEKQLFGIWSEGVRLTPCEYFSLHHWAVADVLSGLFYLCWVPLPVIYCFCLYFTGHRRLSLRFSSAFLFVNLIGFCGYYIYPASPPWYVMQYGFTPVLDTPGNVAGFVHFDSLVGFPLFHSIYSGNANVFAAIPSLHAAYCPIALFYALKVKHNTAWTLALSVVSVGIWWAAVYSGHHYIIDVLLGILTTIIGLAIFEGIIVKRFPRRWLNWLRG